MQLYLLYPVYPACGKTLFPADYEALQCHKVCNVHIAVTVNVSRRSDSFAVKSALIDDRFSQCYSVKYIYFSVAVKVTDITAYLFLIDVFFLSVIIFRVLYSFIILIDNVLGIGF